MILPPLNSLFSVWFSLCTLLVVKRIELSTVFFSFTSCFLLFSLISGKKCHPRFPAEMVATNKLPPDRQELDLSERINNTVVKSIVGLLACAVSTVTLLLTSTTVVDVEFRALALLTGYLSFDLCHAPYCRPPVSFISLCEDTFSLTLFTVALVRHTDCDRYRGSNGGDGDGTVFSTFSLNDYRELILVWIAYKAVRLVWCIVSSRRMMSVAVLGGTDVDENSVDCGKKTNKLSPRDSIAEKDSNVYTIPAVKSDESSHLWTIHGVSYDLSDFVDRHPGGKEAIELGRGRDCTAMFESYHPFTDRHRIVLQRYAPKNSEHKNNTKVASSRIVLDPFYETLKERVISTLHKNGIDPVTQRCATKGRAAYYIMLLICLILSAKYHIKASPLGSILFAISGWLIGSLGHDGGHHAVSRNPHINALSLWGISLLCNPVMWQHQHTFAHHSHTNDFDHDPDLHHFSTFMKVHRRFKSQKIYTMQIYKLYVFWAYTFVVFGECMWIPMNMILEGSLYGLVEWTDRRRPVIALMMGFHLLAYFVVIVVCPFVFSEERNLLVSASCVVLHVVCSGLLFAIFSQINHLNEASMEITTDEDTSREKEGIVTPNDFDKNASWAARQVQTSNNFATQSRFWHFLSNGLNLQIEHHLFPSLNHCHLHIVVPVVRQTCEEFGVCYKSYETWGELMDASLSWFEILAGTT